MTAPISVDRLKAHLRGMLSEAQVVPVEGLMADFVVGCVDGRQTDCITSAPGGNAGLFILLLATLETFTGRQLSESDVKALLASYLDCFGKFYLHTDGGVLARMAQALDWPVDEAEKRLRNPRPEEVETLRREVAQPPHVGCGHLRQMLEQPEVYGTRHELTRAVMVAVFDRLWKGDERLVFEVLPGAHLECGVVQIRTAGADDQPTSVVSIYPHHGDVELFVNHPEAITYLEGAHAIFLVDQGILAPDDADAFVRAEHDLGEHHAAETIRALAQDLPVYDVTISLEGNAPKDVGVVLATESEPRST
ncbi:hypothetical protein BH23BAC4_BH23BAC4_00200 [soil metagenome]